MSATLTQSPAQGVEPAARRHELCKLRRLYLLSSPSAYMSVWPRPLIHAARTGNKGLALQTVWCL